MSFSILCDQLFVERPARTQELSFDKSDMVHRYLQSRIFGGSRGLDPETRLPPERLSVSALSEQVMHVDRLGPYEHQILASILRAPHSLVIITGSTGSGKSSSLRNVLRFYDNNAIPTDARVKSGLNPQHAHVDFNKLEREYYQHLEARGSDEGLRYLYEKVPLRIAQAVLRSVQGIAKQRNVPPQQVVLELAQDAHRWVTMEEEVPGGALFDWPDLLQMGAPDVTGDPARDFGLLQGRLGELARTRTNAPLIYWCAILDALAIRAKPTGKSVLLLLDNIDPLPDHAQRALRDQFFGICLDRHFKTIVVLRHSRFHHYKKGAAPPSQRRHKHTVQCSWYPHCGPSPVEIVCDRLLGFIARPDMYPAFIDLDNEARHKAVQRALDLLLRLTRGSRAYRALGQLALAGAGDSVRRALTTVRYLFESHELSFQYPISAQAIELVAKLTTDLQAVSCTSNLGLALREEMIDIAMQCRGRTLDPETEAAAVKRLSKATVAIIRNGFYSPSECADPRPNEVFGASDVQRLAMEDVETGSRLLRDRLLARGATPEQAVASVKRIAVLYREAVSLGWNGIPPDGVLSLVAAIAGWMGDPPESFDSESRDEEPDFPTAWDKLRVCAGVLATNRSHAVTKILVRGGHLHDFFSDGGRGLSVLPLSLLYYLAHQDDGEAALSTLLSLMEKCAKPSEILRLVNRLCNEKGRVLWINEAFSHDSYEELQQLANEGRTAKLTQGGWAYYLSVLDEIDYTLETLGVHGLSRRHGDLLSGRIEHAIGQLEIIASLPQAEPAGDELWDSIRANVIADILVRCTPGLRVAVEGHFAKMQDPRTQFSKDERFAESSHTREIVISWLELLNSTSESIVPNSLFGARASQNADWQLMPLGRAGGFRGLGPAVGDWRARWKAATQSVERLLRSEKLWLQSFKSDIYRPPVHSSIVELAGKTLDAANDGSGQKGC